MDKWVKGIYAGVGLSLLLCSPSLASIDMMLAAHETDSARIDSLERRLPFLEAKVASTLRDGASSPVSFDGILQMRSQFHNYSGLADSSYMTLARQGFILNSDQPILRLGIVASPGRNATLWGMVGLNASFPGYNSYQFLHSEDYDNTASGSGEPGWRGWYYDFQHHNSGSAGRGVTVYEDLNAGFAVRTRPASFMLKMGTMNWMEASPLSVWGSSRKAFAWEYLPYEEEGPIGQYYNYKIASLEQVGRGVWNKRAFQGVDFSVIDLPGGLMGFFLYGVGKPFDMMHRYHIDMAVDLGYAGDDAAGAGSIIEGGVGDSYRKFIFYRLSKRLENYDVTFGINNGYVRSSSDVIHAGYHYGAVFNQKFDIGRYGSHWTNGNDTTQILNQKDLESIKGWTYREVVSVGEGFVVEPNIVSFDAKGSIGKNFRFGFDVGASWVDTNYIRIDPNSWSGSYENYKNNPDANIFTGGGIGETSNPGTQYNPGRVLDVRTETSSPDIAVYASATYQFKRIQPSLEMFFATENFNSPYSVVNNTDAFWAFGSNMLGSMAFQGMEAAEYSKNLRSLKLSLEPKTTNWHGHLKFGYQLNTQNIEARDILAVPYRLNGSTLQNTLNAWYSKWGLGTITEGYEFGHYQGGPGGDYGNMGTVSKHPQNRFGDQSYTASSAPHVGGLRADFEGASEVFVPFESPEQVIFNYFSGSTAIHEKRDLKSIWHSGGEQSGELLGYNMGKFIDVTELINDANEGNGIKVTDNNGEKFYKLSEISGDSATLLIDGEPARKVAITSETGFVPVSIKKSFDFNIDWALNIGKYVGYKNDLLLSLYYEINGVTRNSLAPIAFDSNEDNDVLLVSHYLRSEPTIGISNRFYITTLIGLEKWLSGKTWVGEYRYSGGELDEKYSNGGLVVTAKGDESGTDLAANSYTLTGIRQSRFEVNDLALGIGFDWDMLKRVSLHGRYKWLKHTDVNLPFNDYIGNVVSLELKAFF